MGGTVSHILPRPYTKVYVISFTCCTLSLAQSPSTYRTGGWMGPTASADANVTAKLLSLNRIGNQFSSHPAHSIHYSDWATPARLQQNMTYTNSPSMYEIYCKFKNLHIFTYYSTHLIYSATCWLNFKAISSTIWNKQVLLTIYQLMSLLRYATVHCSNEYRINFQLVFISVNLNKRKELP